MRLVSWNIAHAATPKKLGEIAEVLSELQCDVVALQEIAGGAIDDLSASLGRLGLEHLVLHEHANGWGLLTASRKSMVRLPPTQTAVPPEERDYPRVPQGDGGEIARILSVQLSSPAIVIHNIHIPAGSKAGWRKVDAFRAVFATLTRCCTENQVVCGDLNEPREERPDGEIVSWAFENRHGRQNPHAWNDAVVAVLRGPLVADSFHRVHGDSVRSMWSHRRPNTVRRYDHVLASPALHPVEAEYVDVNCSDHKPAVVEFHLT